MFAGLSPGPEYIHLHMVTAAHPAKPPHMNDSPRPSGFGAINPGAADVDMSWNEAADLFKPNGEIRRGCFRLSVSSRVLGG